MAGTVPPTGPLFTGGPTAPLSAEEQEAHAGRESNRRMKFILQIIQDPQGYPAFADLPLVFRLVTEERTYQALARLPDQDNLLEQHLAHVLLTDALASADPASAGEQRDAALALAGRMDNPWLAARLV